MTAQTLKSRVGGQDHEFKGLSDRSVPVQLTRSECPDLLNIDFSGRSMERRLGYTRQHPNQFRNASARFNGTSNYVQIPHVPSYVISAGKILYVGIAVVLRGRPTTAVTILHKGNVAAAANNQIRIRYDPAAGAGGQWIATVYDTVAAATRTYVIDDGDGAVTPSNLYRFIEWIGDDGTGLVKFRFWDDQGNVTTSATTTAIGGYVADTAQITVGVSNATATAIGSDFASATLAELRWFVQALAPTTIIASTTNNYYIWEFPDTAVQALAGYWRMNDCASGGFMLDRGVGVNNAVILQSRAEWVSTKTVAIGKSALKFNGGFSWIRLDEAASASALNQCFVNTTVPNLPRWVFRLGYTPLLAPNEATCRDATIVWFGADPLIPGPLSLQIIANQFVFKYRDGGNTRTLTLGGTASQYAGTRLRLFCWRMTTVASAVNGTFFASLWAEGATAPIASVSINCTAGAAGVQSKHIAIGRHMAAVAATDPFPIPYVGYTAQPGDGTVYGIIDDMQLVWCPTTGTFDPIGLGNIGNGGLFAPFDNFPTVSVAASVVFSLPLDEGAGNIIRSSARANDWTARLLPEVDTGLRWDLGLVDVYRSVEGSNCFAYERFLTDGTRRKSKLVVSGATLYDVDTDTQTATAVAAGFYQGPAGTKWTGAQYGQRFFLAGPNGQRPMSWDGSQLRNVGATAPLSAPAITIKAAGGTFLAGDYWFYVTYRSPATGVESNPGPGVKVTFGGGGTNTIDAIEWPISSDSQITQRRLWVSGFNGTDGSVAYLLGTLDDNVTGTDARDILAPVATGELLEFFANNAPPPTALIGVFRDVMFAAGNQQFPTRLWFSTPGLPDSWDQDFGFDDLDQDTGNPITLLETLNTGVTVHFLKGLARAFETGDPTDPIGFDFVNRDHGAVGPAAACVNNLSGYYFSERDIWQTDGASEVCVSSSNLTDAPSIQTTIRTLINTGRYRSIVAMSHTLKNQIWFACSSLESSRNDTVYVFDYSQGAKTRYYLSAPTGMWSRYDLNIDCMAPMSGTSDSTGVYGVIEGYLCRLDTGVADGVPAVLVGTVVTGNVSFITTTDSVGSAAKGMRLQVYRKSNDTIYSGIIYSVATSGGTQTITCYGSPFPLLAAGDIWAVGAIGMYADFVVDWGNPTKRKRLRWIRLAGDSSSDLNYLRVSVKPDNPGRAFTYSGINENIRAWPAASKFIQLHLGMVASSFRIRIAESGFATAKSAAPVPQIGTLKIYQFDVEGEELDDQVSW